jgi:NAD(P)H-hydrate epimerase
MSDSRTRIAELLRGVGQAHHQAFAATNGDDPEWPAWYARYLTPALPELLGVAVTPEALAGQLRTVDAEHRAKAPTQDWAEYYAGWFLSGTTP